LQGRETFPLLQFYFNIKSYKWFLEIFKKVNSAGTTLLFQSLLKSLIL